MEAPDGGVPGGSGNAYTNVSVFGNAHAHLGNIYNTCNCDYSSKQMIVKQYPGDLIVTNSKFDREGLKTMKGRRTPGTCEWIRKNPIYQAWCHGYEQRLWVSGDPGKGKTMLSIFLTEELEHYTSDNENTTLLYYFCAYQDSLRNNAVAVLRSLLHQLLIKRSDLYTHVSSFFQSKETAEVTKSSAEGLYIVLRTLLQAPGCGTVFCVIDGLDECDGESQRLLTSKFCEFFSSGSSTESPGVFKLAIISRTIPGLESFSQLSLDSGNGKFVVNDIQRFIREGVKKLCASGLDDEVRNTIQKGLLDRAQGTFLWAGFAMMELSQKRTLEEMEKILKILPSGLPRMYERMLLQIEGNQRSIAKKILLWVTTAVRPLTLCELAEAVKRPLSRMHNLVATCGPILQVNHDHVTLIHESARDYLTRETTDKDPILEQFRFKKGEAHAGLARTCLSYLESWKEDVDNESLSHNAFAWPHYVRRISWYEKNHGNPLLRYAAMHWPDHARRSSTCLDWDVELRRPFFTEKSNKRKNWWMTYLKENHRWSIFVNWSISINLPLLHMASALGIESLVESQLMNRHWSFTPRKAVNRKDENDWTPLHHAAFQGHEMMVQLLLRHGADLDARNKLSETALTSADREGNFGVVKLLLKAYCDAAEGITESNQGDRLTPSHLSYGIYRKGIQALRWKAAGNSRSDPVREALLLAVIGGQGTVVRLLLDPDDNTPEMLSREDT